MPGAHYLWALHSAVTKGTAAYRCTPQRHSVGPEIRIADENCLNFIRNRLRYLSVYSGVLLQPSLARLSQAALT